MDAEMHFPGLERPPSYNEALAAAPPPPTITGHHASFSPSSTEIQPPVISSFPPSYLSGSSSAPAPPVYVKPTTIHLLGRFLYPSNATSKPLYEISHDVGFLRNTDHTVRFERLDYLPKSVPDPSAATAAAVTTITCRRRHLYNLRHPTLMEGSPYQFYGESKSRSTRSFGLDCGRYKRSSSYSSSSSGAAAAAAAAPEAETAGSSSGKLSRRQRAWSISLSKPRSGSSYTVKKAAMKGSYKVADTGQIMFAAVPARDTSHGATFEWQEEDDEEEGEGYETAAAGGGGGGGRGRGIVAREVEHQQKGGGSSMSLVITAEMEMGKRDLLVAAWVSRVWWELVKGKRNQGWQGGKLGESSQGRFGEWLASKMM